MNQSNYEDMWKIMRESNLEIVGGASSEYTCIICRKILVNACNAPCGCRFCMDCIKEYLLERKLKCPGQSIDCDIEEIDFETDIQVNRVINRKLSKLLVKCPNSGCQSQVELNMVGQHLRICNNQPEICPYSILGCDEDKLKNDNVKDHLSLEIHPHSNLLMNWIRQSQNEMKVLRSDIDKLRTDNEELKEKMRSDEEKTKKIIEDLEKQGRDNCSEIEMLNDEMSGLKNSNRMMKEELKTLQDKQAELFSQFDVQIKNQNLEIVNQSQEIVIFKERCQFIESKYDEIRKRLDESNVQEKFNEISQKSPVKPPETKKSTETIQLINQINDYFLFEIDNFSQKLMRARSGEDDMIFSDPFFTHQNGYKISLDSFFGERYYTIYFHILKGPFDDLLQWPFDRDVELSLINQKTGQAYKSDSIRCSKCPNDPDLQKPNVEKNGWQFCLDFGLSPEEILRNREVCQNDKILIKFRSKPVFNSERSNKTIYQ